MAKILQILRIFGLLCLSACGSPTIRTWSPFEKADRIASQDAQANQIRSDFKNAKTTSQLRAINKKVDAFLKANPSFSSRWILENIAGLSLVKQNKSKESIAFFRQAIEHSNTPQSVDLIRYNLCVSLANVNPDEALEEIQATGSFYVDAATHFKVLILKESLLEKRNQLEEAVMAALLAFEISPLLPNGEPLVENKNKIAALLDRVYPQALKKNDLFYPPNSDSSFSKIKSFLDIFLFYYAAELIIKNPEEGQKHLENFLQDYPNSSYATRAKILLEGSKEGLAADSSAIGVLLPLKGKFKFFAERMLQAIELSLDIWSFAGHKPFTLFIEDSADDNSQSKQAIAKLVDQNKVAAIIGPMVSKNSQAVLQEASLKHVPLFSLVRKNYTPLPYVYSCGLTQQDQIELLVQQSMTKLNVKKFVILSSTDNASLNAAFSFWDQVVTNGGSIHGFETYSPQETDFKEVVDRVSGLYFKEARSEEYAELARQRIENKITQKNRKTQKFYNLTPIVDYDAVFIADDAKIASQIIPTFSYRDVDQVKFLGTASWNTNELLTRLQGASADIYFIDATIDHDFITQYEEAFETQAESMEAFAFDAAYIAKQALMSLVSRSNRSFINEKILDLEKDQNLKGATGSLTLKNNQLIRPLRLFTIKKNQIIPAFL